MLFFEARCTIFKVSSYKAFPKPDHKHVFKFNKSLCLLRPMQFAIETQNPDGPAARTVQFFRASLFHVWPNVVFLAV